jgi:hypothetical protein
MGNVESRHELMYSTIRKGLPMPKHLLTFAAVALLATGCGNDLLDPTQLTYTQVDYVGRPAIATVFLPTAQKDAYNVSVPTEHRATYKPSVVNFLTGVAGYTAGDADALANVLMPDILTVDLSQPSGYLNGRLPADDVTTASLMLVFGPGTPLSDDNVDANDKPYPGTFPYLATPYL